MVWWLWGWWRAFLGFGGSFGGQEKRMRIVVDSLTVGENGAEMV